MLGEAPGRWGRFSKTVLVNWQLYLFVLPTVAYLLIFHLLPLFGLQIAFRDYKPTRGFFESPWVGMKHFTRFFNSYYFITVIRNTLTLTVLSLILGFPLPILLALCLNEVPGKRFAKTVQTVSFAPHFISVVVFCGIIVLFLNPSSGVINHIVVLFGGEPVHFLGRPEMYKWVHVLSGLWQETGWASVIYFAALAGVDVALHEAARIDGASKFQRMIYINFPTLVPIAVVLLIMRCGTLLTVGYEKVYLLQTDLNVSASEVISTYVYKAGLINADYSFSTAVGLFNSVVNCVMLLIVNWISRKYSGSGLW